MVTIREVTEYVFDSPEETQKSHRQRLLWLFAISAGHSFTQSGVKVGLVPTLSFFLHFLHMVIHFV